MRLAAIPYPRAWSIAGRESVRLWLAPYQADQFDLASFGDAGIACTDAMGGAVRQRQAEFFHGRLCARAALAQLGVTGAEVGTGGARQPLWPVGVIGSITHSRTLAAALALPAASFRGVGIDIEGYADQAALASIASTILNRRELALLRRQCAGLDEATLLKLAFSAKESFYKAVYGVVQRFIDFSAIEIDAFDLERRVIGFTVAETLCEEWRCGARGQASFELLDEQQVLTGVLW